MGSGNWIVDNLNSALEMWNGRLAEIWQLISTSPESFKGGSVWNVIVNINDGLKAVGYALLVLFFVMGVVKTCGSFTEMKKPEVAFKCFIRFVLAQAAVSWGMELMTGAFRVAQGMVTTIMDSSGLTAMSATTLPDELVSVIEDVGFIDSIPLWAVTLLGSLFIWVLSLVMILTVYSRFFKLYIATAIAPVPLASFAGQPSSSIGVAFLKSYAAICLEGCVIVLACVIFYNQNDRGKRALRLVHVAAVDGEALRDRRAMGSLADVVFGIGKAAALVRAEGVDGLAREVVVLEEGVDRHRHRTAIVGVAEVNFIIGVEVIGQIQHRGTGVFLPVLTRLRHTGLVVV